MHCDINSNQEGTIIRHHWADFHWRGPVLWPKTKHTFIPWATKRKINIYNPPIILYRIVKKRWTLTLASQHSLSDGFDLLSKLIEILLLNLYWYQLHRGNGRYSSTFEHPSLRSVLEIIIKTKGPFYLPPTIVPSSFGSSSIFVDTDGVKDGVI